MPSSRDEHRNMGWRKPVPKFIPSPPISPTTSTVLSGASTRLSGLFLQKDVPPLPPDWRENISKATGKDVVDVPNISIEKTEKDGGPSGGQGNEGQVAPSVTASDTRKRETRPSSLQHHVVIESTETRGTPSPGLRLLKNKHSLTQLYRPPTPPAPAQHKTRRVEYPYIGTPVTVGLPSSTLRGATNISRQVASAATSISAVDSRDDLHVISDMHYLPKARLHKQAMSSGDHSRSCCFPVTSACKTWANAVRSKLSD